MNMRTKGLFHTIIYLSLSIFLFSCSNSSGAEIANLSEESLRSITDERENSILWTRELEAVRLTRNYKVNQMVSSKMSLSPEAISFANGRRSLIYPYLEGFGSLDTSAISSEARAFLNETCDFISRWHLSDIKMSPTGEFSIILFRYDVERSWLSLYKEPFPKSIVPPSSHSEGAEGSRASNQSVEETEGGDGLKAGDSGNANGLSKADKVSESEDVFKSDGGSASSALDAAVDSDKVDNSNTSTVSAESADLDTLANAKAMSASSEKKSAVLDTPVKSKGAADVSEKKSDGDALGNSGGEESTEERDSEPEKVFYSWLYGEPFFDAGVLEVPIRFYSLQGNLDVIMYVETDSDFSISQIEVVRMRKIERSRGDYGKDNTFWN